MPRGATHIKGRGGRGGGRARLGGPPDRADYDDEDRDDGPAPLIALHREAGGLPAGGMGMGMGMGVHAEGEGEGEGEGAHEGEGEAAGHYVRFPILECVLRFIGHR